MVEDMTATHGDATAWTSAMWDEFAARSEVLRADHAGGAR